MEYGLGQKSGEMEGQMYLTGIKSDTTISSCVEETSGTNIDLIVGNHETHMICSPDSPESWSAASQVRWVGQALPSHASNTGDTNNVCGSWYRSTAEVQSSSFQSTWERHVKTAWRRKKITSLLITNSCLIMLVPCYSYVWTWTRIVQNEIIEMHTLLHSQHTN